MFQPGDKVFAKMKGFPFWPARVDPVPDHVEVPKGKLPVFFYGTHQVSFLPFKSLVSFEANRDLHGKRKNVAKAMEEIDLDPDVLLLGKDPSAEAFWESMYPRSSSTLIELKPESRTSLSVSPLPIKASKRKLTKAPRASVTKRRRLEAIDDDNDSLSSLSDLEDTKLKVTTLDVETLKKGLSSNMEPICDKAAKASRKKRCQTSRDSKETCARWKRSKVSEKAFEMEAKPIRKPESGDISSIDSDVEQLHAKAILDVEVSPDDLVHENQSIDEQQQESKPSRTYSLSSLIDAENNSDVSDGYVSPKAEKYRESNFRTRRAVSSLSDSDEKSLDENLNRNNEIEPSPSYDVNGNGQIREHINFESNDDASIKSSNKSDSSELDCRRGSPVCEQPVEIEERGSNDNAPARSNSENSLHTNVNKAENKHKNETPTDEASTASGPGTPYNRSPKSDKQEVSLDKTEANRSHKRNRKFSESESESGKSSKSSVSEKLSRKSSHNHEQVKAAKKEPESGEIKPKKSVERKEVIRSVTPPVIDTLQLLRNLVFKLKSSLLRGHENYSAAVNVLERVRATPVTLLQLTEVWELTDCVKKCKKYRPSEEVRIAARKTIAYFQKIQSEATKEEVIKVKAILEGRNKARKQQEQEQHKRQESLKTPESKSTNENTPKEMVVEVEASASVIQSPIVNSSPDQSAKRKFSLEALRAELDEKANSLLARLAATEARLMAERSRKSTSNETTPKNQPSSSIQSLPHRKVEEALSRVDEVASRLTVDLDAGSGTDPIPPPPPPPLPFPSQNRLASTRSQNSQPVDLDTRINQLMMGVITPTTTSPKSHHPELSSELPSAKLLAIREEIKRKRKATVQKNQESLEPLQKDKSGDDVIYDLLGV
ncbi:hypothetical protein ACTXT7_004621 [Hymenolepis weldensis]